MSRVVRKPVCWFSTRSDASQAVQPHNMASSLKFQRDCIVYVAKTKALTSCEVTEQLICGCKKAGFQMTWLRSSCLIVFLGTGQP